MKRKSRARTVTFLKDCMQNRPKWWNEAFARYDQKKLRAWTEANAPKWPPKLVVPEPIDPSEWTHDRILLADLYRPQVIQSPWPFILTKTV